MVRLKIGDMNNQAIVRDAFPATIPKKRNNRDVPWKIGLGSLFLSVGCYLTNDSIINYLTGSSVYGYLFFAYIEFIILRTSNLAEECHHIKSRYKNSRRELLLANYYTNVPNLVLLVGAHIAGVFVCQYQGGLATCVAKWGINATFCSFVAVNVLTKLTQIDESKVNTAKIMDDLNGLDCGSVLAHSFFHGYLNLVLPDKGEEGKGLEEQISDYASKNGVKFASKKLYILIPLSGYCPPMLNLASNGYIDKAGSLDWRRINRAGVNQRQYHNSVYKLFPNKDFTKPPIYICAEYASPLATLREIMKRSTDHQLKYETFRYDIVTNFYTTLSSILKRDETFHGLYELVYFSDIDNDGNTLTKDELDVGKMLLDLINPI